MPFVVRELLDGGYLHRDLLTIAGGDLTAFGEKPVIEGDALTWTDPGPSGDETILRPVANPFSPDGGMRILQGNIGRACIKVSAVERERWGDRGARPRLRRPARRAGGVQGRRAGARRGRRGPLPGPARQRDARTAQADAALGVLQNRGFKVALVTDGRNVGASGKVPCAIHCSPEALGNGPIGKIRDGDMIRLDAVNGTLDALVDPAEWEARPLAQGGDAATGMGRELFALFRHDADEAERGASAILAAAGL